MNLNDMNYAGEQELPAAILHDAEVSEAVATAAPVASPSMPSSKPPLTAKFDPARLRVSQSFGELASTRKVLTSVPVTKPNKQQWVRVHPEAAYRESLALIEVKESRTMYLVDPALAFELSSEVIYVTLYTAMTREGMVFLWPARLPEADGRPNARVTTRRVKQRQRPPPAGFAW